MRRFKRSVALLLVMAMLFSYMPATVFAAENEAYSYTLREDGTVSIDSYTGKEGSGDTHLTIPSEIDGAAVTHLSQEAFAYNDYIDTIVIPASVASIDNSVFYHCTDLKAIVFLGDAPGLGFTVAEGSTNLEKLFVLNSCEIGDFCALLVNDLGEEEAAQVEVLEFADLASLQSAYDAYVAELTAKQTEGAESTTVDNGPVETYSTTYINPCYENLITEADLVQPDAAMLADEVTTYHTTTDEAGAAIREDVKARNTTISVGIQSATYDEAVAKQLMDDTFETALIHTGNPTEGDYLRWQMAGYESQISGYSQSGVYYLTITYTVTYYTTLEQEKELDAAIDALLTELDLDEKTDYEKVCGIYDYICDTVEYDYDNLSNTDYKLQYTAYAALINGKSVCQGYALLFYRLALTLGIDSRFISGTGTSSTGTEEPHGWNIVKLGDLYYNVDATWDINYKENDDYQYFLRCNDTFLRHTRDTEYADDTFNAEYPMATADYTPDTEVPEDSNTCGENLIWSFDETNGILTISGTGAMDGNASVVDGAPWYENRSQITSVVIANGVSSIGAYAFNGCTNLTSVTIPESVTAIDVGAFYGCTSLSTVALPAGLTNISKNMFFGCTGLTELIIPENVTSIGIGAFYGCQKLAQIQIPQTVTELGSSAFGDCDALTEVVIPEGVSVIPIELFVGCYNLESVTLPSTVQEIKYGAFLSCPSLTSVEIPEGVTTIPAQLFMNCYGLTGVTLPSTITEIASQAFCDSGVKELTIPAGVTSIEMYAFDGSALECITFTGDAPATFGQDVFRGVTATAYYPANNDTWTSDVMLDYGGTITWTVDGEAGPGVTESTWGETMIWTLDEATGILTISGTGEMPEDLAGAPWAESADAIKTVVIEEGVTSVCSLAFDSCTNLSTVLLPNSLETIGDAAFSGCTALDTIMIPAKVTSIGSNAFNGCTGLQMIYMLGQAPVIGENAFAGMSGSICYNYQDSSWDSVNSETYGGTIQWVMQLPWTAGGLYGTMRWDLFEYSMVISGIGDMESQTSAEGYPWYASADSVNFISVTDISSIGDNAFAGFANVMSVSIYDTVTKIGAAAFSGCSQLSSVTFGGDAPSIAADAFTGVTASVNYYPDKTGWTEETLQNYGGTLTWLPVYSGTYGEGINWQIYEYSLRVYGSNVDMENQTSAEGYPWNVYTDRIKSVYINGVNNIGDYAFAGLTALSQAQIQEPVAVVGKMAFANCSSLNSIGFYCEAPEIAEDAFTGVTADAQYSSYYSGWTTEVQQNYGGTLTWSDMYSGGTSAVASGSYGETISWELTSDGKLTISGSGAMEDQSSAEGYPWYEYAAQIQQVRVDGVTSVGDYAFAGYTALTSVSFAESVAEIGTSAFSGSGLTEISFAGGPPEIAEDAFTGVTAWAIYPYSYESAWTGKWLDYGGSLSWAYSMETIASGTLANGVSWNLMEDYSLSFYGSGAMENMEAGTYPWSQYAEQIRYISLNELTSVGDYAFQNFTNLSNIWFDDSVASIGTKAFGGCSALANIHFGKNAPEIAADAFEGVTAEAGYHRGGTGWTEDKQQNYGGTLTWYGYTYVLAEGEFDSGLSWQLSDVGELNFYGSGSMPNYTSADAYPWYQYRDQIQTIELYGNTNVGDFAFRGYTNLETVISYDATTTIGQYAFAECTSLSNVELGTGVTTVGDYAFSDCENLTTILFVGNAPTFGENAFYNVTANATYPANNDTWTSDVMQSYGGTLTWVQQEGTGDEEGMNWYMSDGQLIITGSGTMDVYESVEAYPWYEYKDQITSITINGITGVSQYAFQNYTNLTSVFCGNTVISVGSYAFDGCIAMTEAYFDGTLTTIGDYAFRNCVGIRTIDAATESIGAGAFSGCTGLNIIYFEDEVPTIAVDAFTGVTADAYYPGLSTLWTEEARQNYGGTLNWLATVETVAEGTKDNYTWWLDTTGTLYLDGEGTMADLESVDQYPWYAYKDSISRVHISGLTSVGAYAFQNYTSLTGINYYVDNSVIGKYAFAGGTNITDFSIGNQTEIGEGAFQGCTGIHSFYPSENLTTIGSKAFDGCSNLNYIWFEGLTAPSIAEDAFSGVEADAWYPENQESWTETIKSYYGGTLNWSSYAYTVAYGEDWYLQSNGHLYFNDSGDMASYAAASEYPWHAYRSDITCIYLNDRTSIGDYAFQDCVNLTGIEIPAGITKIGEYAFGGCTSLEDISFGGNAPAIAATAFTGVTAEVNYPDGYYSGWDTAIQSSYGGELTWKGTSVAVASGSYGENDAIWWHLWSDGLLQIGGSGAMESGESADAYPWQAYAQYVTIVDVNWLTSIGDYAFSGMEKLHTVRIYGDAVEIGSHAFADCTALAEITIPACVTAIGDYAFSNCGALTSILFEGGAPAIGANAFAGVTATARYDGTLDSWTEDVRGNYGGTLTWTDTSKGGSGTCGDLAWVLDENGLLTISGSGAMGDDPAWKNYSEQIKSVVIESGATSISMSAFSGLSNMTSISIPNTVTSIGANAFGMSGLTSVVIPGSVTQMGDMLFFNCMSLETVEIQEGVTELPTCMFESCMALTSVSLPTSLRTIGNSAFVYSGLTGIEIPEGVTKIGDSAFWGCPLKTVNISSTVTDISSNAFGFCTSIEKFTVAEGNPNYSSDAFGVLYDADKTQILVFPAAFSGVYTLPATVSAIADNAFENCAGITGIYVEEGNQNYSSSDGVLFNYGKTSLVRFPGAYSGSYKIPVTVTEIRGNAFANCTGLTGVVISRRVALIGASAFINCSGLTSITFQGSAPAFGNDYVFNGVTAEAFYPASDETWTDSVRQDYGEGTITWNGYERAIIANGTCGDNLAWELDDQGVLEVTGTGAMTDYNDSYPGWESYLDQIEVIEIGEGVTHIGDLAFFGCTALTEVVIPDTVTSIGGNAFSCCTALTAFEIPAAVTSLGADVFDGCSALTELTVETGNEAFCVEDGVLFNKDKTELVLCLTSKTGAYEIPEGVQTIIEGAFSGCSGLTEITLASTITTIEDNAFASCTGLTGILLPASVTSIGSGAFSGCSGLTEITIPGAVTFIGENAFRNCAALVQINVEAENQGYASVDGVLFTEDMHTLMAYPCAKEGAYTVPEGVTEIAQSAFYRNQKITGVVISEGVTSIGELAFANCSALVSVQLPDSLKAIEMYAFQQCGALAAIELPEGLTSIGQGAFFFCSALTSVHIPGTVTTLEPQAFASCGLTEVTVGYGLTDLGAGTFANCSGLTAIHIPNTVERFTGTVGSMEQDSFYRCENVTVYAHADAPAYSYAVDQSIPVVETAHSYDENYRCIYCNEADPYNGFCGETLEWSFQEETGVLTIHGSGVMFDYTSPDLVTDTPNPAPWNTLCEQITEVVIGEGVAAIGDFAFFGCKSMATVTIPVTVNAIGRSAFTFCTNLISVTIPEGVTEIASNTFYGCSALKSVNIPATVTSIISGAFQDCAALETVEIPAGVTFIGAYAFKGCVSLHEIVIPASVEVIGDGAFGGCVQATFRVEEGNNEFSSDENGGLFNKTRTTLIQFPATFSGGYVIPESVTIISAEAFANCTALTAVTIPAAVKTIFAGAFRGCTGLTNITFQGSAPSIGEAVFSGVTATAGYPETDTSWDETTKLDYDGTITWEGYPTIVASGSCGETANWTLSSRGLLEISGSGAMDNSQSADDTAWSAYRDEIVTVVVEEGITTIGDYAFSGCENLTGVTLPVTLTGIGDYGFYNCHSLNQTLVIPESVEQIGAWAFADCSSLAGDFVIPDAVTEIGAYAFQNCTGLTGLTLGSSLISIGERAFYGCSGLTGELRFPDSTKEIGASAFVNCTGLTGVTLGSGLTSIGTYAFAGCTGLTGTLVMPAGLTALGTEVFDRCAGIERIEFVPVTAPAVSGDPFGVMENLTSVYVPADNFDSYAEILAYLSESVEVDTEWEKLPVDGLTVDRTYSKTVVLSWQPHISGEAVSYTILRDGEAVGTSTECTYTDRNLAVGAEYTYTICANLAEEVQSIASEPVVAVTTAPAVTDITAYTDMNKVAEGFNTLTIQIPTDICLDPLGDEETYVAAYYVNGEKRSFIGKAVKSDELSTDTAVMFTVQWDLGGIADGEYEVIAVITDVDGASAEYAETVTVDNTLPAQLELVVTSAEEEISINWTMAKEIDTTMYRIYRKIGEDGQFQLLKQIEDRTVQTYTDTEVEKDQIYFYYVVAVDILGREGTPSETAGATLSADTEKPRVIDLSPAHGSYLSGTVTFTMKAEDNVSVTGMELYYSVDDGSTWTLLDTTIANTTATAQLDTRILETETFQVKALAYDEAGNVSDDFINSYAIDNVGPGQVTGLGYEPADVSVLLTWSDVADADRGWFLVEQKLEDGTYVTVQNNITALGVNVKGLTPESTYTYRVTAYDVFGNPGVPSEDITVQTLSDTNGPVVVQILPASGRYSESIALQATVQDDFNVVSAAIQVSTDGYTWTDVVMETYEDVQTVRTIRGTLSLAEMEDGNIYIRATAVDSEGNVTESTSFVEHYVDKTAPAAPETVTAAGQKGYVEISWTKTDSDVVSYAVYRGETEDGEFVLIKDGIQALNFFDRDVEPEKTYYYQVSATDSAGNRSGNSAAVSAASLPDTDNPEIVSIYPANEKTLSVANTTVSVLAMDNTALATILIEYSRDGETYKVLSETKDINVYNMIATAEMPLVEFSDGETVYIRATATDTNGLSSEPVVNTYTLDLVAPVVNEASAQYQEETEAVAISWTGAMEEDLAGYRIYRKTAETDYRLIGQVAAAAEQSQYSMEDDDLASEGETYIYRVVAVDGCGNSSGLETGEVVVPERTMPTAVISCDAVMVAGVEYVFDAGLSTDNAAIVAYEFDFGDETEPVAEKTVVHAYEAVGEYTVTLTVTDDEGNQHTVTQVVYVTTDDLVGTAKIRIVDENGNAVPGAPVYFDLGEETQMVKVTDSSGYVTFVAEVGKHSVGCVIPNNEWLPVKHDIIVSAGATTETTMTLVNRPMVEGYFETRRMTLEEIAAAGIDITKPENQYYVELNLHLTYGNMTIDSTSTVNPWGVDDTPDPIYINWNPNPGPDPGGKLYFKDIPVPPRVLYPYPMRDYEYSEEAPIALLDIPVGVSTLKEFYDVYLHVINNASSDFSMLDNVITLEVPEGMTLMDEAYGSENAEVRIDEIKGQTTESVEWILRGDAVGDYYLSADYSGILSDFNEPISTRFEASDPIQVRAMSDLKLIVDVAKELDKGTLYYNISLVNEGKNEVYRPTLITEDILIEMELFDAAGAATAEEYHFDAATIDEFNLSTSLNELPGVLKAGERLTLHYMSIDQTDYTECVFQLTEKFLAAENVYGLEAVIQEQEISYFLGNLSTSINAAEKADQTFSEAGSLSAYEYIMNDEKFLYWGLANDKTDKHITSDEDEKTWELISMNFSDAFGKNDIEQARAMILASLEIAAEENVFSEYRYWLNWLAIFKELVDGNEFQKQINEELEKAGKDTLTAEEVQSLSTALEMIENSCKWELYVAIKGNSYNTTDKLITDVWAEMWCEVTGQELTQDLKTKLHNIYSSPVFKSVWEKYGTAPGVVGKILDVAEDVAADISVYVKAQSEINTYNFYLDQLLARLPQKNACTCDVLLYDCLCQVVVEEDMCSCEGCTCGASYPANVLLIRDQLLKIKETINSDNIWNTLLQEATKDGYWTLVQEGSEKVITKIGVPGFVTTTLEITTSFIDLLMNMDDRSKVANNIRFVEVLSDTAGQAVTDARAAYASGKTDAAANEYMMLLSYMLDLRALGESQAAEYGLALETEFTFAEAWFFFSSAANYIGAPGDLNTWIALRDYLEDEISRCRVELLKNPLSSEVTGLSAPVVTFNYETGATVQTFTDEYEYSLDGGSTWTTCAGTAIAVERPYASTVLKVRRVDTSNTDMKMTASVTIYGPTSLLNSGIEVIKTDTGYRVINLNNNRNYEVLFTAAEQTFTYDSELGGIQIPAGSYSYEYMAPEDAEVNYVYIRSLTDEYRYASYIYCPEIRPMVNLTTGVLEGQGEINADTTFEYGAEATVTATPAEGWLFQGWYDADGVQVSGNAVYSFNILEDTTLEAKFVEISTLENNANLDAANDQATGFPEETSVESIVAYYEALGLTATVTTAEGEEVTGNVGTGCKIQVGGKEFTVVVKGDVDGTGEVDVFDVLAMLAHTNDGVELEGAYFDAANVTVDEDLDVFDVLRVLDYTNNKVDSLQ